MSKQANHTDVYDHFIELGDDAISAIASPGTFYVPVFGGEHQLTKSKLAVNGQMIAFRSKLECDIYILTEITSKIDYIVSQYEQNTKNIDEELKRMTWPWYKRLKYFLYTRLTPTGRNEKAYNEFIHRRFNKYTLRDINMMKSLKSGVSSVAIRV